MGIVVIIEGHFLMEQNTKSRTGLGFLDHFGKAVALLLWLGTAMLPGQTFTTLASFGGALGGYPLVPVIQGIDGNLYGTAQQNLLGTVFRVNPDGIITVLFTLDGSNGSSGGQLLQAKNGDFYGTTNGGGSDNYGMIYRFSPGGLPETLYSFDGRYGAYPGPLIEGTNGNLYGETFRGGLADEGTIFEITPSGVFKVLCSFSEGDGQDPSGGLVLGTDGNFYGTAYGGGRDEGGTVFKTTPAGNLTTLYYFTEADGTNPEASLIQGSDGAFYGTAFGGGLVGSCKDGCGTVFRITSDGAFTVLHRFVGTDGDSPAGALIQATDENLYGTTIKGGTYGAGTIFRITLDGKLTVVWNFNLTDGRSPEAALTQATSGIFYGTTQYGGTADEGTVFSLSVGLDPFVTSLPSSGGVGSPVRILGSDLSGATSVTFNGVPVAFAVTLPSEIVTSVPANATTGVIQVVTPRATLLSNKPFRVLQ
jgi:uncharacterized repeat protein (TIGR03803 family)